MSTLTILTEAEQADYEHPPQMDAQDRALCFTLTDVLEKKIKSLRSTTNKVGFLLQYGYFKHAHRFFPAHRFLEEDILYVADHLGLPYQEVHLSTYTDKTPRMHQVAICQLEKYHAFDIKMHLRWLSKEVKRRVEQCTDPRHLFFELLQQLQDRKIVFPSYYRLADIISQHYHIYETELMNRVDSELTLESKKQLDHLLKAEKTRIPGILNQLKIINQSKKPKGIQSSIDTFKKVAELFTLLLPVIQSLHMTPQRIAYYSTWVTKSKLSQLKQFPDRHKTYLHLLAFIQHQYYCRQDTFVTIFLKAVQTAKNTAKIRLKENDYLTRGERRSAVHYMTKKNKNYKQLVNDIQEAVRSPLLTDAGKIEKIMDLLEQQEKEQPAIDPDTLTAFEKSLDSMVYDNDYFDILEKLSIKLQNKVSGLTKILEFNADNSDSTLMTAIDYYKQCDGVIHDSAPNGFLSNKEKSALLNNSGKFRTSLYKILLFIYIADGIKSGALNLKYSYQYLSISDYLIEVIRWEKERDTLIQLSGLTKFSDVECLMNELKIRLNNKYHHVNTRLKDGKNPYVSINDVGIVHVVTPALQEKETEHISAFLSQTNYVPIVSVLSKINELTHFKDCFVHHSIKNSHPKPKTDVFSAGIIGLGCNIGIPKMAHISSGINQNTLRNTVNWYFSVKNMEAANRVLVKYFNRLTLTSVFITEDNKKQGSSDGRKVNVAIPCLLANRSFKYFGKGSGVSIYTFIDERQALFYSTVISASEREAAYVIDGLNHNDVVKIDIHSTDSHGFTEQIFATTHFMSTSFAPRLKNIGKQNIYGFSSASTYQKKGYQILPSRTINQKIIKAHWEDILRFMVTIKLKESSASQLFKRLSSYAKDNPLYKAIKEFGRIIKSIFILTYYDDVKLRQRIEKQLNRIELSNKFGRAVFYDNSGEFKQASSEEQQIITGCTVLVQNAIVLWNYLYLSQLIADCKDENERQDIIDMVRDGSIMHWSHINLHGEFDFCHPAANEIRFDVQKILKLEVV